MLTVNESMVFQRLRPLYWSDDELAAFITYIACNPFEGDVVPESGGVRKVRWGRRGMGKAAGMRIVYFTRDSEGEVVLLTLYPKSKTVTIKGSTLKEIRHALED